MKLIISQVVGYNSFHSKITYIGFIYKYNIQAIWNQTLYTSYIRLYSDILYDMRNIKL